MPTFAPMLQTKSSPNPICFRRWTRKNYAVFSSMGKQIKIGVLGLTLSLVTMSIEQVAAQEHTVQVTAREGESNAVPLDEVMVSAAKTLATSEPARVVSTISRREIAQLPVQDLPQLLEYVAGVDLRQRGANNVQADISIRGGSYDQALILLNGVNITDPQTGHYSLDLPVDLQSIDRIEILQGPGSRTMGPNAFSGAINIVTGSSEKSSAQASVSGGSYGYFAPSAGATFAKVKPLSALQIFGAASYSRSDGYIDNTDFCQSSYFAQARYTGNRFGSINAQAGYQQKAYGANGFYSLTYPNQFDATRTLLTSVDYQKSFGMVELHLTSYFRRHYDKFELFRSNPPAWYTGHNYHRTDVSGSSAHVSLHSILGTTHVGYELRNESIYSNVLGDPMSEPIQVKGEADSTYYTHSKSRFGVNWFVEQAYFHKKFSASIGAQGSYSNDFGHYTCFNADFTLPITQRLQLSASVGQTLRLPTFTDLYYRSATHLSNPYLKPEQATTYELGVKYLHSVFRAQTSVFYRQGKNIIDWVRTSDTSRWQSQNHISLNTLGVDFSASYTPQNSVQRFVKSLQLSYAYLHMDKDSRGMYNSNALDYLRHKLTLTGIHPLPLNLGFSWSVIHEQRAGQYSDFTSKEMQDFTPVTLVDAKLSWGYRWVTLYVEASNLFNVQYFDYANLLQPGKWIKSGIKVKVGG